MVLENVKKKRRGEECEECEEEGPIIMRGMLTKDTPIPTLRR